MTYCIGIKTKDGIVVASDSRTNAGLDNVNIYSKMFTYDVGDRTVLIVTSGNLGTSQAVYKSIEKDLMSISEMEKHIIRALQAVLVERVRMTFGSQMRKPNHIRFSWGI